MDKPINEFSVMVDCPIHLCRRPVWVRELKYEDIHLIEVNGCDDLCGAPECRACCDRVREQLKAR